jgi:hypothetical protein
MDHFMACLSDSWPAGAKRKRFKWSFVDVEHLPHLAKLSDPSADAWFTGNIKSMKIIEIQITVY